MLKWCGVCVCVHVRVCVCVRVWVCLCVCVSERKAFCGQAIFWTCHVYAYVWGLVRDIWCYTRGIDVILIVRGLDDNCARSAWKFFNLLYLEPWKFSNLLSIWCIFSTCKCILDRIWSKLDYLCHAHIYCIITTLKSRGGGWGGCQGGWMGWLAIPLICTGYYGNTCNRSILHIVALD